MMGDFFKALHKNLDFWMVLKSEKIHLPHTYIPTQEQVIRVEKLSL